MVDEPLSMISSAFLAFWIEKCWRMCRQPECLNLLQSGSEINYVTLYTVLIQDFAVVGGVLYNSLKHHPE